LAGPGDRGAQLRDGMDDLHAANLAAPAEGARRSCMRTPCLSFCS
jgi:hypothetical protein